MPLNIKNKVLNVGSSPHIKSGYSVDTIMRHVVYALLPVAAFAVYSFGLAALLVLATSVISCLATEHLLAKQYNQSSTIGDWSAVITGIIYALTLPPGLPLWMVFMGGVIGIALGKLLFGGLGSNVFNPALVARAFLQAAFPASLTHWTPAFTDDRFTSLPSSTLTLPFLSPVYDAVSSATPLAAMKFSHESTAVSDLLFGLTDGSLGETSSIIILLGGVYLVARNMMNWRIPVGIFLAVIVLSSLFHWLQPDHYPGPVFMLFSGGLMLGAVFMATDMVASPITNLGCFIYGVMIGALIVIIRYWSGLPEGVMYAILFMNAVSPHIDNFIQPVVFGSRGTDR
ncbi:MAG: RnfABCDGE type electron transport complex subunit D [Gammaproteobacteria bacterium]